ncbi:hypothetical protein [Herbaspirillum huttiense]|uniref:hypothetical protein n=1 Tax=Herbaspirillum huttiense TaxID=863372 RepID=UPI0031E4605A
MADVVKLQKFHAGQKNIYRNRGEQTVIRCGRRFGKTTMFETSAANFATHQKRCGWFAPTYKLVLPSYNRILAMLRPIVKSSSRIDGIIELETGGAIEFWTLVDEDAGRSRFYDEVFIDEASLVKKGLRDIWEQSIAPTLLDRGGNAWMAGTPKGIDDENYFYQACIDPKLGWKEFHAPTSANPMLDAARVAALKDKYPPLVYQQEYLAEFVDWSGAAFFSLDKLTQNGAGVEMPQHCDYVFAVIDSAMKDGTENDGTAVIYFAVSRHFGIPLTILDWDIIQINSDMLTVWLPNVFHNLEHFAKMTKARQGSVGAFIEDKASGITLNQHSERMGYPGHAIEGDITNIGKDGRALAASGPVFRDEVKIAKPAFEKVKEYKNQSKNHLIAQVCGYRIGDKDAHKRADDLADCFTYGVIIGLNGSEGF